MVDTVPSQEKQENGNPQPTTSLVPSLPPEAEKAFEKLVQEGGPKAVLALITAVSSRTTSFGPDAETSKIIAQSEMHEETCRLEGYKNMLHNKDNQNERDHKFRIKKLNHESMLLAAVMVASIIGVGTGLYLVLSGKTGIGSPILVASFMTVYYVLGGRSPLFGGKE